MKRALTLLSEAWKEAADSFKTNILKDLALLNENYQKLKSELLTAKYEKAKISQGGFLLFHVRMPIT